LRLARVELEFTAVARSGQTDYGANTASNLICTRGLFPGGKLAATWSWPLVCI